MCKFRRLKDFSVSMCSFLQAPAPKISNLLITKAFLDCMHNQSSSRMARIVISLHNSSGLNEKHQCGFPGRVGLLKASCEWKGLSENYLRDNRSCNPLIAVSASDSRGPPSMMSIALNPALETEFDPILKTFLRNGYR